VELHPWHHPSYIDFFEQVAGADATDRDREDVREELAGREWYRHLYARAYAYRRAPFYMCTGARTRCSTRGVIIVGATRRRYVASGSSRHDAADALEMAEDIVVATRRSPSCKPAVLGPDVT